MKIIEKGYHIEITTSENDGDNYKTEEFIVSSMEEVEMIIRFIKYFYDCNRDNTKPTFGNSNNNSHSYQSFEEYIKNNDKSLFDLIINIKEDNNDYKKIIKNLVEEYIGIWGDGDFIRVLEDYNCFYVPEYIAFNNVEI